MSLMSSHGPPAGPEQVVADGELQQIPHVGHVFDERNVLGCRHTKQGERTSEIVPGEAGGRTSRLREAEGRERDGRIYVVQTVQVERRVVQVTARSQPMADAGHAGVTIRCKDPVAALHHRERPPGSVQHCRELGIGRGRLRTVLLEKEPHVRCFWRRFHNIDGEGALQAQSSTREK